ncbi:hypothetical protein R5R35_007627 [Gryllus longicercus]|uniref:C-type lectin domain-containing protein n=1 Tax=Gryllus longicercus TaxID=2509291 RepID=A0AAN9VMV3_9ORTH
MHYESKNWNEAKVACEDEGGYLVFLDSPDEANLASGFLNKYNLSTKLHIGMFDVTTKGTFITVLGDDVSSTGYDMWAPGEPNHLGLNIENCGTFEPNRGINDEYCTSVYPFLCELFT